MRVRRCEGVGGCLIGGCLIGGVLCTEVDLCCMQHTCVSLVGCQAAWLWWQRACSSGYVIAAPLCERATQLTGGTVLSALANNCPLLEVSFQHHAPCDSSSTFHHALHLLSVQDPCNAG